MAGQDVETGTDGVTKQLASSVFTSHVLAFTVDGQVSLVGLESVEELDRFSIEAEADEGRVVWHGLRSGGEWVWRGGIAGFATR